MSAAVEKEKCHRTKQFAVSTECQDAVGIEAMIFREVRFRDLNSGHQAVCHFGQLTQGSIHCWTHPDLRASRQQIEITFCGQWGPFHNRVAHLSSLLPGD